LLTLGAGAAAQRPEHSGTWSFVPGEALACLAMPNARMPAPVFMPTAATPSSATLDNPPHDYPQADSLCEDGRRWARDHARQPGIPHRGARRQIQASDSRARANATCPERDPADYVTIRGADAATGFCGVHTGARRERPDGHGHDT
jgi:hypothetical protein